MNKEQEAQFDKEFGDLGEVYELCYKEETTYGCDKLCNQEIKTFISNLLKSNKQELIDKLPKELPKCKVKDCYCHEELDVRSYNQCLKEIKELLKE